MPARILVADDEPYIRQFVGAVLERAGHCVTFAQHGHAALEEVRRSLPDLILLDVMMPRMDGFQVLQHLKADPELAAVPVVMLTPPSAEVDAPLATRLGPGGYLTKPFSREDLLAMVEACLPLGR